MVARAIQGSVRARVGGGPPADCMAAVARLIRSALPLRARTTTRAQRTSTAVDTERRWSRRRLEDQADFIR